MAVKFFIKKEEKRLLNLRHFNKNKFINLMKEMKTLV
ncbi:hypothetical protein BvCmsKSP083_03104 [Escherichia coli]|nr:hypothetical protein BvCmsKSP083_03104 [Escherichia coli]